MHQRKYTPSKVGSVASYTAAPQLDTGEQEQEQEEEWQGLIDETKFPSVSECLEPSHFWWLAFRWPAMLLVINFITSNVVDHFQNKTIQTIYDNARKNGFKAYSLKVLKMENCFQIGTLVLIFLNGVVLLRFARAIQYQQTALFQHQQQQNNSLTLQNEDETDAAATTAEVDQTRFIHAIASKRIDAYITKNRQSSGPIKTTILLGTSLALAALLIQKSISQLPLSLAELLSESCKERKTRDGHIENENFTSSLPEGLRDWATRVKIHSDYDDDNTPISMPSTYVILKNGTMFFEGRPSMNQSAASFRDYRYGLGSGSSKFIMRLDPGSSDPKRTNYTLQGHQSRKREIFSAFGPVDGMTGRWEGFCCLYQHPRKMDEDVKKREGGDTSGEGDESSSNRPSSREERFIGVDVVCFSQDVGFATVEIDLKTELNSALSLDISEKGRGEDGKEKDLPEIQNVGREVEIRNFEHVVWLRIKCYVMFHDSKERQSKTVTSIFSFDPRLKTLKLVACDTLDKVLYEDADKENKCFVKNKHLRSLQKGLDWVVVVGLTVWLYCFESVSSCLVPLAYTAAKYMMFVSWRNTHGYNADLVMIASTCAVFIVLIKNAHKNWTSYIWRVMDSETLVYALYSLLIPLEARVTHNGSFFSYLAEDEFYLGQRGQRILWVLSFVFVLAVLMLRHPILQVLGSIQCLVGLYTIITAIVTSRTYLLLGSTFEIILGVGLVTLGRTMDHYRIHLMVYGKRLGLWVKSSMCYCFRRCSCSCQNGSSSHQEDEAQNLLI